MTRFTQERSGEPAEDQAVIGAVTSDLAAERLRAFLSERLGRRRVDVPGALRDLGMVTPEGGVRLATLLVFGREPQRDNRRFGIVVSRYEGPASTRPVLRDRTELSGPLPRLVEDADRAVYEAMRRDAVVRGSYARKCPSSRRSPFGRHWSTLSGIVTTASGALSVQARLFDDAVEIESPGTLAGYVTVDNLRDAEYSRNVRIMDLLQRLRLAEEAGTGIDKMISEMEDAFFDPPEFEERSGSFLVRFKGGTVFTVEDRLWVGRFKSLALPADAKVALVQARREGSVSNEELRESRRLDRERSRSVLQDLVARNLMVATGRGRGTRYVLSEAASALVARGPVSVGERLRTIVAYAERNGSVANRDVRGLMGVGDAEAWSMLETAVSRGCLSPSANGAGVTMYRAGRRGPSSSELVERLQQDYRRFTWTTYPIADAGLRLALEALVDEQALLWRGPYLSVQPRFAVGESLDDLARRLGMPPEVVAAFPVAGRLFCHQVAAIERIWAWSKHFGRHWHRVGQDRGVPGAGGGPCRGAAPPARGEGDRRLPHERPGERPGGPGSTRLRGDWSQLNPVYGPHAGFHERIQQKRDILTNYSMLEFVLTRREDRRLFGDGVLRHLVLDEVHSYQGALGTEIACLVRRLRGHVDVEGLVCIGLSATVSSGGDRLAALARTEAFASRLFAAPFYDGSVVGGDARAPRRPTSPASVRRPPPPASVPP